MKKIRPPPAPRRGRDLAASLGLHIVALLVPLLPYRFMRGLGRALGRAVFACAPGLRRIALANLVTAFGDSKTPAELRQIARNAFANLGSTLVGLFWAPRLTPRTFGGLSELDLDGLIVAHRAQARGRGVIFITLHWGDWELLGLSTGFHGIPLTVVQEHMRNESLARLFKKLRGQSGHRVVPGKFAAAALYKTLRRGGNIALLIDLTSTRRRGGGVWLDFFGLPVFSPSAVGALAVRTGAAIVMGTAEPLADGGVRLHYGPEIAWNSTGDAEADALRINQECLALCEKVIRTRPELWIWPYKRFSPRATPEQGRYPDYSRYLPEIAPGVARSKPIV
jgi:KDO2-lipid IV(A) lauroyltransferase